MHVVLSKAGRIEHCGPTLAKLWDTDLIGQRFLEVFELKRPRGIDTMAGLRATAGQKLHLQMRSGPMTGFKGVLAPSEEDESCVINLSFGMSIIDAVHDFELTNADFAPTDLTTEMLYLVEAKSAAMEASRKLNLRLQGAKIAAEEQAYTDTLTGLKNRRAIDHILSRQIEWDSQFALMQVDLDWFKAVNDTYGHAAGDHVLQTVARVMVEETRENDTVARVGGDEFVIVLPNTHDQHVLTGIGNRIIERLTQPIDFQGKSCRISASIGTALFEQGSRLRLEDVVDNADLALYASKHAGRGRQTFYTPDLRDQADDLKAPIERSAHP
jgi:diguanylate cyclase (GGDEF)-like protein